MAEKVIDSRTVIVGGFPIGGSPTARKEGSIVNIGPGITNALNALDGVYRSYQPVIEDTSAKHETATMQETLNQIRALGLEAVHEISRDVLREIIRDVPFSEETADVYALVRIAFARLDLQEYEKGDNWLEKQRAKGRLEMRISCYTELGADGERKLKPNDQLFRDYAYSLNLFN